MGKGERQHESAIKDPWEDINDKVDRGQVAVNNFIPVPEIELKDLDFDNFSDVELIAKFGGKSGEVNDVRPKYCFPYFCHATYAKHVEAIEKEGLRAGKGSSSMEFDDCYFTWVHLYPYDFVYDSPDDIRLKESIAKRKDHLLKDVENEEKKSTLGEKIINSAMFRVKLFPFLTHNFIASIPAFIEEYKSVMKCDEIDIKKYGTFLYTDKGAKYLTECMYGIVICPKGTEKFASLDNLSDDNDILQFNSKDPLEGSSGWNWVPYSSSRKSMEGLRLWDYIGFAFYMKDDEMRLKPTGDWKGRPIPNL